MTTLYQRFMCELPEIRPWRLRNGVDAYGFTKLLSDRLGIPFTPRVFADWLHGWCWGDPSILLFDLLGTRRDSTVVVTCPEQMDYLCDMGFTDVRIGGLPFAYVQSSKTTRLSDCLLAIPPHSAPSKSLRNYPYDYFDYLESLKVDFEDIFVMIHHCDFDTDHRINAERRGLKAFMGARPDDSNALCRVRRIMDQVEVVTSNTVGSHMVYALYCGCRFSFCGPMYDYSDITESQYRHHPKYSQKRIQSLIEHHQKDYLEKRFGKFFVEHPQFGVADLEYASFEIGAKNMMNGRAIKDALGWTVFGQLGGYLTSAARRVRATIK